MNCQDIADRLDERRDFDLTPVEQNRLSDHLRECEACESGWRAARILRSLNTEPARSPRRGFFNEAMCLAATVSPVARRRQPPSFWLGGALGAALAASILVVTGLGVHLSTDRDDAPRLAMTLHETRDIDIAIDSPDSLVGAEIRIALTGGIELQSLPGRREIRWRTDIDAGVNRLRIPVSAIRRENAQLLVEVEHGNKTRRFLLDVEVRAATS